MALVGGAMSAPTVGRVLLLNVVSASRPEDQRPSVQTGLSILQESMATAIAQQVKCEALATISQTPFEEFRRVIKSHGCSSLLLGLNLNVENAVLQKLEHLMQTIPCHTVLFRTRKDWNPRKIKSILIPVGGRRVHDTLRARILAGLNRYTESDIHVTYLLVSPQPLSDAEANKKERLFNEFIRDEVALPNRFLIRAGAKPEEIIMTEARQHDLLILGLTKPLPGKSMIGHIAATILKSTELPVMLISARQ